MKRIFTKIFTVVLTLIGVQSFAQTTLVAGDIAFVGYATDSPDRFAFLTMVDLQANTVITFTDNSFNENGALNHTEDSMIWNSGSNVIVAGTVIEIMTDSNPGNLLPICNYGSANNELDGLSGTGDQVIAFQGNSGIAPTFIAALTSNAFKTTGVANANNSYVPTGLTDQFNAIGFPNEKDNGYYDCVNFPSTGTPAQMLASINDSTHWVRSNTNQTWPTCSIVLGAKSIKESNVAFKAFPNPSATGVFNLTKNANVQVYNMVGVNVMNAVNTNSIDISGLSAGIYIVRTNNNEMIKIVKSN